MLIAGFPAGALQANCYLLAAAGGTECLVIDPGENSFDPLQQLLTDRGLTPVAALLTHGHLDHVAGAAQLCRAAGIPAYLHEADQPLLDDPLSGLSEALRGQLAGMDLTGLRPPEVRGFDDTLEAAGLRVTVDHVPGHTKGSVVFRLPSAMDDDGDRPELLFTGDTLFAGSVGRTDLPGGSWDELRHSLKTMLLTRPDGAVILPGHGPSSTIGTERAGNPFLIG